MISYELKSASTDSLIYRIELTSEITNKTWYVTRGYKEFLDLHAIFLQFFIRVPYFPQNLPERKTKDLEIRKTVVEKYLKVNKNIDLKGIDKKTGFYKFDSIKEFLRIGSSFQ